MEVRRIYMQEQMQINKVDIGIMIGDLERTGKYSDDQIQLIREDLLYGLSKESIERYTQKKYDRITSYNVCYTKLLRQACAGSKDSNGF